MAVLFFFCDISWLLQQVIEIQFRKKSVEDVAV